MDIKTAKSIPIDELLLKLGYQPVRERVGRKWYKSPFRNENTASFVLSKDGAAWYDHGEGVGGNIIDLAMRLGDCTDVSGALSYLDTATGHMAYSLPTIRHRLPVTPDLPAYALIAANDFHVHAARGGYTQGASYLISRGIDPHAVTPYVRDIVFAPTTAPTRKMYGIGLPNNSGGYEVRARINDSYIKTSVGHKDYSFFPATKENRQRDKLHIFEGAPDFWTFLTANKNIDPTGENFLILNGTGMVNKAMDFLNGHYFDLIMLWNQNDPAGNKTVERFLELPQTVGTMNHMYEGFKDYNAWHMDNVKPVIAAVQSQPMLKTTPKIKL
ncbi:toprim domain-containing protein [Spirosoma migulaei]